MSNRGALNCVKVVALLLVVLLLSLPSCGEETAEIHADTIPDTLHYLAVVDSIGVELGDSTLMLGNIWGVGRTPSGEVFILDKTVGGLRFYDEDGHFLSTFAPIGEGPGEFLSVSRVDCDSQGNFYMTDFYSRKVAKYDSELNFLSEIVFDDGVRGGPARIGFTGDGRFIVLLMLMLADEEQLGTEVAVFSNSSEPDFFFRRRMVPMEEQLNAQALTGMAFEAAPDGRVYIGDRAWDRYQIICYSQEGDSLFSFGIPGYEPVAKSDSLVQALTERARQNYINYYGTEEGFNYEPEPFWYPVTSVQVDGENRVWVRGERETDVCDVFTAEGEFLYRCELRGPTWQDPGDWNMRLSPEGFFAWPRNPELYPVMYMLEERTEIIQAD